MKQAKKNTTGLGRYARRVAQRVAVLRRAIESEVAIADGLDLDADASKALTECTENLRVALSDVTARFLDDFSFVARTFDGAIAPIIDRAKLQAMPVGAA